MLRNADATEGTIVTPDNLTPNNPVTNVPKVDTSSIAQVVKPRNFFVSSDQRTKNALKEAAQKVIDLVTGK